MIILIPEKKEVRNACEHRRYFHKDLAHEVAYKCMIAVINRYINTKSKTKYFFLKL